LDIYLPLTSEDVTSGRTKHNFRRDRASLVAQMIKNLPAMPETRVQSLSHEEPLEKGMATHSSILAWKIPLRGAAWRVTPVE